MPHCPYFSSDAFLMPLQVVKKGKVQLQNRLVPDGPVQDWSRRIEDLQPDIDRVLQVFLSPLVSIIQLLSSLLDCTIGLWQSTRKERGSLVSCIGYHRICCCALMLICSLAAAVVLDVFSISSCPDGVLCTLSGRMLRHTSSTLDRWDTHRLVSSCKGCWRMQVR